MWLPVPFLFVSILASIQIPSSVCVCVRVRPSIHPSMYPCVPPRARLLPCPPLSACPSAPVLVQVKVTGAPGYQIGERLTYLCSVSALSSWHDRACGRVPSACMCGCDSSCVAAVNVKVSLPRCSRASLCLRLGLGELVERSLPPACVWCVRVIVVDLVLAPLKYSEFSCATGCVCDNGSTS